MVEGNGYHPHIEENGSKPEGSLIRPDILEKLQAGIEAIHDSDSFKDYLEAQTKFWRYSANNVLLIMQQRPDATKVNSYNRWKDLDRQVVKGSKGIKILFPMFKPNPESLKDPSKPAKILTGFGVGNVFDIGDTEGKPLPMPPEPTDLEGNAGQELLVPIYEMATADGLQVENVERDKMPVDLYGFYIRPKNLIVVKNGPASEMAATLTHEYSHHLAGHGLPGPRDLEAEEWTAEGSAYIVAAHHGLDTGRFSFPYLATAIKDRDKMRAGLGEIQRVSSTILGRLEAATPAPAPVTDFGQLYGSAGAH